MSVMRFSRFVAVASLACLSAGTHAMGACASDAAPWLTLKITAGALAPDSDRTTVVQVHANGCAQVHRPAYLREAGDFRVALKAEEVDALRTRFDSAALRHFDAPQVRAKLTRAQQHAARGSEYFNVSDADLYEIEWADAKSHGSVAWAGLPSYAQAYPEITALKQLDDMATALKAVALRSDAVRMPGDTP